MGFLSNFIKVKADQTKDSFTEMLAKWDPETATQAELGAMYTEFINLSTKAEKARTVFEKEKAEAKAIVDLYNKKKSTLEILQEKAKVSTSKDLVDALDETIKLLEDLAPEVEREIAEANEAEEHFNVLYAYVHEYGEKFKTARKSIENAKRRAEKADILAEKAKERESRAKDLAGIKKMNTSTGAAFDALTRAAEKKEADARAADERSKVLSKLNTSCANALIKEIEAGATISAKTSINDRISKLPTF